MKHIVIFGNPTDGFNYVGPFDTRDDALGWADDNVAREYDWWIATMAAPEEN